MNILHRLFPPNIEKLKHKRDVDRLIGALSHREVLIRQDAVMALGELKDPRVVEPLAGALKDANNHVQMKAAVVLANLEDPRGLDFLFSALRDTHRHQSAQDALEKLFSPDELSKLTKEQEIKFQISRLQDESWAQGRESAVEALIKLSDPAVVEPLIGILNDARLRYGRSAAARVLGELGDKRAVEPLVALLENEESWGAHEDVVKALARICDGRALEPLMYALTTNGSHHVRCQAATALGKLGDPRATDSLIVALNDKVDDVRMRAAFALAELGGQRAAEGLMQALMRPDEQRNVRETIENALRTMGADVSSPALEPLIAALKDQDRGVSSAAAEAMVEMGAGELLVSFLQDADKQVRESVARALRGGDARAIQPLVSALKDKSAGVREAAVYALGQIAGIRVLDHLAEALQDESVDVRKAAVFALGGIGSPVEKILMNAMENESESVRKDVEGQLQSIRQRRRLLEELMQSNFARARSYLNDENWMTRGQAVDQLADLVAPETLELLSNVLKSDSNARVRKSAVDGIGKLAVQRAMPEAEELLLLALDDEDRVWVGETAAVYLGRLGGEKSNNALRQYRLR